MEDANNSTKNRTNLFIENLLLAKIDYITGMNFAIEKEKATRTDIVNKALGEYVQRWEKETWRNQALISFTFIMDNVISELQNDIEDFRQLRQQLAPLLNTKTKDLLGRVQGYLAVAFPVAAKPVKKLTRKQLVEQAYRKFL